MPLPRVKGIVKSYAFIAMVVALAGCGGSAREGTVEYSVSAAQNYELGMKKLKEVPKCRKSPWQRKVAPVKPLGIPPVAAGAIHNMLRRVKRTARATPPFYGRRQVVFNDTQLRNHYRHLDRTIKVATEQRRYLPGVLDEYLPGAAVPTPNQNCTWDCPFLGVCPMMDDGSDWVGMLNANYRPRTNV